MRIPLPAPALALASLALAPILLPLTQAQQPDLYDDTLLRTIDITLPGASWWNTLVSNWSANQGTNLIGDLTIDGPDLAAPVTIQGIGFRIKGNSSFFFLPSGSQKASFNIEVDATDPEAELWGYETLNLNNGIEDPTFCREITFFRFIRDYTPAGRGNHVVLNINGQPWGVYVNVQQYNQDLLEEYFEEESGPRYKAQNINPGGGALDWLGTNVSNYSSRYQLKDDGGLATPWQPLIDACNAIDNPGTDLALIDEDFSVDAALWSIAAESLFMDEDSYLSKGADFNVYFDPLHGQAHLNQHDGNESWGVSLFGWPGGTTTDVSPNHNMNSSSHPVIQNLWAIPEARQRFYAHMRTLLEEFTWAQLEPQLIGYRDLIDAAVQADPKKLYTYFQFTANFFIDTSVQVGFGNIPCPGLERFVNDRRAYLLAHPDIIQPAPVLSDLSHSPANPNPGDSVTVTVSVNGPAAPVGNVTLHHRDVGRFLSTPMFDDGQHADGAAGDGVYGADLPLSSTPGATVDYYVGAATATGMQALTFEPRHAEGRPRTVTYTFGGSGLRITEYMYSGQGSEFIELSNTTTGPIDLTGWSLDDESGQPGVIDLSGVGVLPAGRSMIVTDLPPIAFDVEWGLAGVVPIVGPNVDARLGRNDAIYVFDASGVLSDRLVFGDEAFPGSVRAQDVSASACMNGVGADDPYSWNLASVGDALGSITSASGDVGNPGSFSTVLPCLPPNLGVVYCSSNANSTGTDAHLLASGSVLAADNNFSLTAIDLPPNHFGYFVGGQVSGMAAMPGGSQGVLCLAIPLARFTSLLGNSGPQGELSGMLDLTSIPLSPAVAVQAGQTWFFQGWFRDTNPGPTSNFTDAIELQFQ